MKQLFLKLKEAVLRVFFPENIGCIYCSRPDWGDGNMVCPQCQEKENAVRISKQTPPCFAPFFYQGCAKALVLRLKSGEQWLAKHMAARMVACLPKGVEWDFVSFAPIHPRRLPQRGFDQAKLLATEVAKQLGKEMRPVLINFGKAKKQAELDFAHRLENEQGNYGAEENLSPARILFVDDICTTGATLSECCRVLKNAGAKRIDCLVFARTKEEKGFPLF